MIRATGTEWPLTLKRFPPNLDWGVTREALLIDFADDGDARVREDVRRRVQGYERCGYTVVTAPDHSS